MKKAIVAALGVAAVCAFTATNAQAVNVRPVAVQGTGLQDTFDDIGSSIDVQTDQVSTAYWEAQGAGGSIVTLFVELAGFADINEFGIYKYGDPSTQLTVFDGSDDPATTVAISFDLGTGTATSVDLTHLSITDQELLFGSVFGFYLISGDGGTYYSDDSLNPGGKAMSLAYAGQGDCVDVFPPFDSGPCGSDAAHYYIAWEDLLQGDDDYDDGVFIIESITPVAEPGLLGLLGMGFVGIARTLRRRQR